MATIRPFSIYDLLEYNNINLDVLTETFGVSFYGKYIAKWPEYCVTMFNSTEVIFGYLLGKVEGDQFNDVKKNWHGHVTAVTVAPVARRQGIGMAPIFFS
jgi:N-terminal acetyltransferase B complex catalytic subunit